MNISRMQKRTPLPPAPRRGAARPGTSLPPGPTAGGAPATVSFADRKSSGVTLGSGMNRIRLGFPNFGDELQQAAVQFAAADEPLTRFMSEAKTDIAAWEGAFPRLHKATREQHYENVARAYAFWIMGDSHRAIINEMAVRRQRLTKSTKPLSLIVEWFLAYGDGSDDARIQSRRLRSRDTAVIEQLFKQRIHPDGAVAYLKSRNQGLRSTADAGSRNKAAKPMASDTVTVTIKRGGRRICHERISIEREAGVAAVIGQVEKIITENWDGL